jgi:hypothetical protein
MKWCRQAHINLRDLCSGLCSGLGMSQVEGRPLSPVKLLFLDLTVT